MAKKELNALILDYIKQYPLSSSSDVHEGLNNIAGYATVKRGIQKLLEHNLIVSEGKGRATKYRISDAYVLLNPVDPELYFKKEIDQRNIKSQFNHALIRETLSRTSLFTKGELSILTSLQNTFNQKVSKLTKAEYKQEFERLAIDLSWKSSQIEGNTYSLLETERLLKEKETASGKTKDEAVMLLNHKEALDFISGNPDFIQPLRLAAMEDIHSILIKDLQIERNLRSRSVGISGTNYRPLDIEFQIREAMDDMCALINQRENVFEKALLVLVLISYIQPFADGNKRTARIISNAILIHYHYSPLSFRTVNSLDYKKAMLIFYEQNNISAFKDIFIEQYRFAVDTYF